MEMTPMRLAQIAVLVMSASLAKGRDITVTCDNKLLALYADGQLVTGTGDTNWDNWRNAATVNIPDSTSTLAINCSDVGAPGGMLADLGHSMFTDGSWKCTHNLHSGWETTNFDDSAWPGAVVANANGGGIWGQVLGHPVSGISTSAHWIWTAGTQTTVYCRRNNVDACTTSNEQCGKTCGVSSRRVIRTCVSDTYSRNEQCCIRSCPGGTGGTPPVLCRDLPPSLGNP